MVSENNMCRTEDEIRQGDLTIQELEDYIQERQEGDNGDKHIDVLNARVLIKNRITGLQTQDDVTYIRGEVEDMQEHRIMFPSVLELLAKIPMMGWPLLLAMLLFFWLFARMPMDTILMTLDNLGVSATGETVYTGIALLGTGLAFTSLLAYNKHIETKLHRDDTP